MKYLQKAKIRVILNLIRTKLHKKFPYEDLTDEQRDLYDDMDEYIMNLEDEL